MREPLTYAITPGAAEAAPEAARAEGARVWAVVVNRGGIPKVLLGDDGVGPMGVETARRKAYTTACASGGRCRRPGSVRRCLCC